MHILFRFRVATILLLGFNPFFIHYAFAQKTNADFSLGIIKTGCGKAMILIPGLYCSGRVWDETVEYFKDRYTCYEITLPGFAGQPVFQTDSLLKTTARRLAEFIKRNKLEKPIIVGHSLGGFIALQLEILYPGLTGSLVIVSSAPFLPALSMSGDITIDSTRKIGQLIKNAMKNLTVNQIVQYQKSALPMMIRDTAKIVLVTEMAAKSDMRTQGEVMCELFSTDLRLEMKHIHCPVLVLGDWSSYSQYGATRESVFKNYSKQFQLASDVTISMNDSSRHFIMYDEPQWFFQQVDGFLGRK